jgi:hypothetical protein
MTPTSHNSGDLYHYSENGISKGPFTAKQLKDLAAKGAIKPQTYVWKAGFRDWVPAGNLKGLLPQRSVVTRSRPHPATMVEAKRAAPPRPRIALLTGIIVAGILLVGSVVTALVILVNKQPDPEKKDAPLQARAADKKPDAPQKSDGSVKKPEAPQKPAPIKEKDTPAKKPDKSQSPPPAEKKEAPPKKPEPATKKVPPPPPPVEIAAVELLKKYKDDSEEFLKEFEGKRVTLKIAGTWNVDQLEKALQSDRLVLRYSHKVKDKSNLQPHESIRLNFPLVNSKAKLGFFAKIEAYAKQRKKGERVVMSVTGTLKTTLTKGKKYLVLENAILK